MKRFLHLIILLASFLPAAMHAQQADPPFEVDSTLEVSLLTCSPGNEVYELYGHTAIRVRSDKHHYDVVYNYGVFSFDQPNFVWRFVLGECDYFLWPLHFDEFMTDYRRRGSEVVEQVLNLKVGEANRLLMALAINFQPENRTYRYDIFRSNCTTKVRDIIEANLFGPLTYPARAPRTTIRQILHEYTQGHPWAEAGNDLLLGADVDTLITFHEEMFAPIYLMNYADSAMFCFRNDYRPMVRERRIILEANPELQRQEAEAHTGFPLSPAFCSWFLFALMALLGVYEVRRGKATWWADATLMAIQGLIGVLLTFMMVFSSHPGVGANWQVIVLNPVALVALPFVVKAARRGEYCKYHGVSAVVILLFILLMPFMRQHFSVIMLPLALCLLSRNVVHILLFRKH